jgi:ABC-type molybdenum transport system ATPase subunit/photorepair protein PhrA
MPTDHPRIQVTEDRELRAALHAAAPHLPAGLPRSRQVRELAIVGARHLSGEEPDDARRQELLEELARSFEEPETAGVDWELLREGKRRAWPIR